MTATSAKPLRAPGGVGLFGGTFDPIHLGHLRAAEETLRALQLDRIVFVPSAEPPHKTGTETEPMAPAVDRMQWLRLAVKAHPKFEVDAIELTRPGPSYSVDTLRALAAKGEARPPVFIIGCDAFRLIAGWREPEALFALADFAVLSRPPSNRGALAQWIPEALACAFDFSSDGRSALHRSAGTRLLQLEIDALDISSSEVRAALARNEPASAWLPPAVHCAVIESGHYRGANECAEAGNVTVHGRNERHG